jgi:two-component system, LytTR family, sensor kinase
MKRSIVVFFHIVYWSLYLLLMFLFLKALPSAHKPSLVKAIISPQLFFTILLPGVIGFYLFYFYLFNSYLKIKRLWGSVFGSILLSLAVAGLCFAFVRIFGGSKLLPGRLGFVIGMLVLGGIALLNGIIALIIKGAISWYDDIKLKEELNRRNYEMELELIKSQINPHFLFNTINNIDVLIQKDPGKASLFLNKLSDIMRFMLYETHNGRISLAKELAYIEKYIELQRIRSANENYVHYIVEGDPRGLCLEPMLFVPFIENAFKHATSKNEGISVDIKFVIDNTNVSFLCENKYSEQQRVDDDKGIGAELMKRRLNLLYPGKHELSVMEDEGIYKVKLEIKNVA